MNKTRENSLNNKRVHTAATALNEECQYDVQCESLSGSEVPAALCLGGACSCSYDARAVGNPPKCWRRKRPGQDCDVDEVDKICTSNLVICTNQIT